MIKYVNGKMTRVPHGQLTKEILDQKLELLVLQSNAGWYIGTADDGGPVSRESEYFTNQESAKQALHSNNWMQRNKP